jgi:hypothetical protein
MTRFDPLLFAAAVALLAGGCATTGSGSLAGNTNKEASNTSLTGGGSPGISRTISDPNAIKDRVRQPGLQVGRTM